MLMGIAALLKAVAWPLTVLVVVVRLQGGLSDLLGAASQQISRASKLKFRGAGITLELAGEILRGTTDPSAKSAGGPQNETESQEFERLVTAFEAVTEPDPARRAAIRRPIADRLGHLAVSLKFRRAELAAGGEGRVVAFATACILAPTRGDLAALEIAVAKKRFKYTAYRLGLALVQVLSASRVSVRTLQKVQAALDALDTNSQAADDAALSRLIDTTREVAEKLLQEIGVR